MQDGAAHGDPDGPRVLVLQDGARHNYAVPAAFARAGMLEAVYTSMCAGRGLGGFAERLSRAPWPGPVARSLRALASRRPPAEVLERTHTFDLEAMRYEMERRMASSGSGRYRALHESLRRRGDAMARRGLGKATHLFATLNDGGRLRVLARERGLAVASDMIIALSTAEIVKREHKVFPEWGAPPLDPATAFGGSFKPAETVLTMTDRFICPSEFVRDDLITNWGASAEAIRVVPYAVSPDWLALTPDPKPGRILFVGTADRRKGIHYLAMAADILRARGKNFEIRVVGGVEKCVVERPLCRGLTFLGRVPRVKVHEEFVQADALVLPSLAEGSATVTYEALAAGLPVVTTKAAGSIVRDGIDGFIIPERDPESLARAIENIVEDRDLRGSMSASARRRASEYSWEAFGRRLLAAVLD